MEDDPTLYRALLARASAPAAVPPTPEIRLLAAILEDACFCLHPGAFVSPDTRAEALAWVRGEVRSAALCSFREVCDVLGLDVQAVRNALLARAVTRIRCATRVHRPFTGPPRPRSIGAP